jgi:hypothetical protein
MMSPNLFEFPIVQLEETKDIDKIQKEMAYRKELEAKILLYTQLYLERRNMIMLTLKHGITPIYELQPLPIAHQLYAFLMCKKTFLEMSEFLTTIHNRVNIFKLVEFWNEFIASP